MPVPETIDVYFDDGSQPIVCRSVAAVDAVLDRLHSAPECEPRLAVAIDVYGHQINLGLRADRTFLCLQFAPCDGEYYLAVGDQTTGEDVAFYGAGQDSYWRSRNLISMPKAREAVRYFIENQRGLSSVRWEDWNGQPAEPDATGVTGKR